MNHTERIIHVSRQVRGLTREKARAAVELYLASVAEEAAHGETVTLPSIGRLRIACFKNGGRLKKSIIEGAPAIHDAGYRLQTCVHLTDEFKAACRRHLLARAKVNAVVKRITGSTRIKPG